MPIKKIHMTIEFLPHATLSTISELSLPLPLTLSVFSVARACESIDNKNNNTLRSSSAHANGAKASIKAKYTIATQAGRQSGRRTQSKLTRQAMKTKHKTNSKHTQRKGERGRERVRGEHNEQLFAL